MGPAECPSHPLPKRAMGASGDKSFEFWSESRQGAQPAPCLPFRLSGQTTRLYFTP